LLQSGPARRPRRTAAAAGLSDVWKIPGQSGGASENAHAWAPLPSAAPRARRNHSCEGCAWGTSATIQRSDHGTRQGRPPSIACQARLVLPPIRRGKSPRWSMGAWGAYPARQLVGRSEQQLDGRQRRRGRSQAVDRNGALLQHGSGRRSARDSPSRCRTEPGREAAAQRPMPRAP
jgi:hypothetical protein